MNKCVWILNHYAQSPNRSGGTRHFSLAYWLKEHNWDTYIIASSDDYGTGKDRLNKNEKFRLEEYKGVHFLWLRNILFRGNSLGRMMNMGLYTFKSIIPSYLKQLPRPDVIIGSSVHPFAGWAGSVLAKRYKVPFIFEVRDLWPETLINLGAVGKNGIQARLLRALEAKLYKDSAKIISVLPNAYDYIKRYNIPEDKIVVIENGVEVDNYPLKTPDKNKKYLEIMYIGTLSNTNDPFNNINAIIEFNRKFKSLPVKYRIIGGGYLKKQIEETIRAENLSNVVLEGAFPKEAIPEIASQADVFIHSIKNLPQLYKYGISPNKFFDYMAASRPVILSYFTEDNQITKAGGGILVEPENPLALADAVEKMCRMSYEDRVEMGLRNRKYVEEHHDFKVLAKKLADVLNELV